MFFNTLHLARKAPKIVTENNCFSELFCNHFGQDGKYDSGFLRLLKKDPPILLLKAIVEITSQAYLFFEVICASQGYF